MRRHCLHCCRRRCFDSDAAANAAAAQRVEWLWNQSVEIWAICSSASLIDFTAHSLRSRAPLARSAALTRLLARSHTRFGAHGKEVYVYELNVLLPSNFNPMYADCSRCWVQEIRVRFDGYFMMNIFSPGIPHLATFISSLSYIIRISLCFEVFIHVRTKRYQNWLHNIDDMK